MITSLADRRSEIAVVCRRFHVSRLDVFGSAARGVDFDPERSDADFVVEFEAEHAPPALADFLGLREALEGVVGRRVDLTMAAGVRNPYVRAEIERTREPVYGA